MTGGKTKNCGVSTLKCYLILAFYCWK